MAKDLKFVQEEYDRLFKYDVLLKEYREYYHMISKLIPSSAKRILDVACGKGLLLAELEDRSSENFGSDISHTALKIARKNAPSASFVFSTGEQLPFGGNSFDAVTCLGSLEHFMDPLHGAKEMNRVMKKDCICIISLPNKNTWMRKRHAKKMRRASTALFRYVLRLRIRDLVRRMGKRRQRDEAQPIDREYSADEARKLFKKANFKVERETSYERHRMLSRIFNPSGRFEESHVMIFILRKK